MVITSPLKCVLTLLIPRPLRASCCGMSSYQVPNVGMLRASTG